MQMARGRDVKMRFCEAEIVTGVDNVRSTLTESASQDTGCSTRSAISDVVLEKIIKDVDIGERWPDERLQWMSEVCLAPLERRSDQS